MQEVLDALQFAKQRHKGQVRRGSGEPYITHPVAVSYLVAAYKRSKRLRELIVAAMLHDVVEDTSTTIEEISRRFGVFVASLVLELTNDKEEILRHGKLEYQSKKLLSISGYALVIKLADRLHNISDAPTPKMVRDTLVLIERLRAGRKLTKTQEAMVSDLESLCHQKQALQAAA
ncbi:guanosine-3',5'-bis(Diphosphate) 3'-pyrophosphohydrolase [Novimethylophilus kurashikiensis]|uniref:Guanosine-3',5'-bis(Diphosphate) 3'-pyrophosphohydrolase n=1 Tax=Novimethylophilus kurashikiensis TaxID=1825523 RepID=A0A2R5F8T3_9PROT|nr:HD domain-containing protein [Novimethylophilus kurashikiensis]GBG14445.1 guanosine-3',5'-bis(Diphosphate) 3'-pyrophosphohydrolase [Novimethylophilus kurashikiensis]